MTTVISDLRTVEAARIKLLNRHIGCTVEILAGPDDLTADRGVFRLVRAGDAWTECAAVVDFERNGRFAIPVSLLFIPGCDQIVQETSAFVLTLQWRHERKWMCVSFRLVCETDIST